MSRTKVDLPKDFSFQTIIPIRITDVNYGGHVGNDTVLTLLHEARMQFLKHHGFSEMDFGGAGLIMSDVIIEFKKEIFYGEEIKIFISASNFSKIGFDVFYMVVKSQQEIVVAKAKTGMVCYDYKLKKIVSIPERALQSFK
jgi:YbgC/YbaW family acyl-CoA thioester hydrolase